MASGKKSRKNFELPHFHCKLCNILFFVLLITSTALLQFHKPIPTSICAKLSNIPLSFSGDLRTAQFSWNHLQLVEDGKQPLKVLKIAVFSRKWPVGTIPGGMERHAFTLHKALAHRGHQVHVFTSPLSRSSLPTTDKWPKIHCHEGEPGSNWRYNLAWELFAKENRREPFDVVHSESVALPHWLAKNVANLAVSWHGIAMESVQSDIYQDLIRKPDEPLSPAVNRTLQGDILKVLNEVRFFKSYAHHIAISDSCGEILRDVYQIPNRRVHVILNGVEEHDYEVDVNLGQEFRSRVGVPANAGLVLGAAGRLVKDKGHPMLYEAFSNLMKNHTNVYLIVAGSGPWQGRYMNLGKQVIVLGSMNPSQLKAFYNSIDVFVNPTLRPQGLDLTLMEAMMSGKPILASRFPSIRGSVVVNDDYGSLFSPNVDSLTEALEKAIREGPTRLNQRGKACRRYAMTMFTASKMALAYERLFLCIQNETFCYYP